MVPRRVVAGLGCFLALIALAACGGGRAADPDPGGHILASLQMAVRAVPPGARIEQRQTTEPHLDRCTGSRVTGFGPATLLMVFRTSLSAPQVVGWVGSHLESSGWTLLSVRGSYGKWRRITGRRVATVILTAGSVTQSSPTEWSLLATSPAAVNPLPC